MNAFTFRVCPPEMRKSCILELDKKISVDFNTQKEEFSYAYLYAIASAGGYSFQRTTTPLDQAGIDLILTGFGFPGLSAFPQLYVQLWNGLPE